MEPLPGYEGWDPPGVAARIRTGDVGAREVAEAAIARIERRNPSLNAVIHETFERGLASIDGGVGDGPFAGVPFLLKDLGQTWAGVPTSAGSRALEGFVPPITTTLVQRFLDAGVVILGKTNTPELGMAPVTEPEAFGITRNPWHPEVTAGGSSGGAAAAVAAGMVPVAHASDGGGSIRIPASHQGLFGLKPTRARTPVGPLVGEAWFGMSVGHVVSRSVRDSAGLLDAVAGPEPGDPYAAPPPRRPFVDELETEVSSLRVGVVRGAILGDGIDPECVAAVEATVGLLESMGHRIREVTLPIDREALVEALTVLSAAEVAHTMELIAALSGRTGPEPELYEASTWALGVAGRRLSAADLAAALFQIRVAGRRMGAVMEELDVVVSSTLGRPPWPHGILQPAGVEREALEALRTSPGPDATDLVRRMVGRVVELIPNTPLFNMTGQPAMSVPLHWTSSGLPVGVQFAARLGDEATLFRLAARLEEARPWRDRRPPPAEPAA